MDAPATTAVTSRPAPAPAPALGALHATRRAHRSQVGMRAWVIRPDGSDRGYALDLSETGARIGGVTVAYESGDFILVKLDLGPEGPPMIVRAEVVRWHGEIMRGQVCVRFLGLTLDDWFRLARCVDRAQTRG